ncbi:sialate O-acetylesterase [Chryseobacterium daeguense]|uniref:sialate O-acetylesterase n=1 Tax=Chryseobacterium daeguense TaxID=412438 RepID=UPI000488F47F|nr:sialate O-acetylesterase [Chryseobacterium daeguense]
MAHSFLLAGQSNMAGRGFLKDVDIIYDEHIKMLRNGRWQTMVEPVNFDRPNAGIGLSASFAAAWRMKNESEEIGLIPCADGGTSLDDWAIDGVLFQHAVAQAKLAQKTSKLEAILWHQGENDANEKNAHLYSEKFSLIVKAFRTELNDQNLPVIMGGLGDFLSEGSYAEHFSAYPVVNDALLNFARTTPHCYFVTASGLTSNPDHIHINSASLRKFGVRYFEAFDKRQHILKPLVEEDQMIEKIYQRELTNSEKIGLLNIKFFSGILSENEYKAELSKLM